MSEQATVEETVTAEPSELSATDYRAFREKGTLPTKTVTKTSEAPVKEAQTAEDSETSEDPQEKEESEKKPEKKGGFQRKIDKLVARTRELEALLASKDAAKAPESKTEAKPDSGLKAPKLADFNYDLDAYETAREKYTEQLLEAKLAAQNKAHEQTQKQQQKESAAAEEQKAYNARVIKFEEAHPDFREVAYDEDLRISPPMADVIRASDQGPEVLYYLGNHPEEAQRISELSPRLAGFELGKIEAKLSAKAAPEVKKPKESKAPEPINPVGARANSGSLPLDRMSLSEYRAARDSGRIA